MLNRKQSTWLLALLAVALAAVGLLAFHTIHHAREVIRTVRHARHTPEGEALRPWMSIPYIAASHQVPPKTLYDAIGVAPERHRPRPLSRIARQQHRPVNELIAKLEDAIALAHGHAPPHGEVSPP